MAYMICTNPTTMAKVNISICPRNGIFLRGSKLFSSIPKNVPVTLPIITAANEHHITRALTLRAKSFLRMAMYAPKAHRNVTIP